MAVLPDTDRQALTGRFSQLLSLERESCGLLKSQTRAVLNAVDDWIDSNAASYNAALPLPQRTILTARQKARLLMLVIARRFEVS